MLYTFFWMFQSIFPISNKYINFKFTQKCCVFYLNDLYRLIDLQPLIKIYKTAKKCVKSTINKKDFRNSSKLINLLSNYF